VGEARHARIAVAGASVERLEHALAEACEAGALGAEQGEAPTALLWIYTRFADAARVREALLPLAGLTVGPVEALEERAWSEAWKEGLEAIVISPRLAVRPGFRAAPPGFGGAQLVIEPGQAFGTGGHLSTRLALETLDALPQAVVVGAYVLDVGCGSGVLALAALALGAKRALACDIDPLATSAARQAAVANGLVARLALFTGSLDALAPGVESAFELIVANLLRRELEPLLPSLARLRRPGGCIVLSGLLAEECDAVAAMLAAEGLRVQRRRLSSDAAGERWLALEVGAEHR
jgi:ribosomal protein L11 methyltransferase